ncbi:MAG: hypothetical protein M1828_006186 [Chrysothrix sp. TS-e1954]|nr:MAG: hypothetical protein M1828_006186 [Chrysothrix sp. TS-e1954]
MATAAEIPDRYANRSPQFIGLAVTMIVVAVLCTLIRIWARVLFANQRFWWDDWFAILAAIISITQSALEIFIAHLGFGKHAATIPPAQLISLLHYLWINIMIWGISIAVPKYSVIFMYARVFQVNKKAVRISLWALGILNTIFLLYNIFSDAFQCNPVRKAWLGPAVSGTCIDSYGWYLSVNLFDLFIDVIILIFPLPLLWSIQMETRKKVYIMLVFIAGYSVIAVTIGRLITLAQTGHDFAKDPTWITYDFDVWAILEAPLSIFCITIPSMNNLAKRGFRHGFGSLLNSRSYDDPTGQYSSTSGYGSKTRDHEEYLNLSGAQFAAAGPGRNDSKTGATTGASSSDGELPQYDVVPLDEVHIRTDIEVRNKETPR